MDTGESLRPLFKAQQAAFGSCVPDYRYRMQVLGRLRDNLREREADLVEAVSADFGGRCREETLTLELFALYSQINHTRRNLKKWMRRRAVAGAWFLQPGKAFYQYQPLGVVGVIGTWNYPLLLALGPMVEALAAGNHVMLKPSEIMPRTAQLIDETLSHLFPPAYVACVKGGPEIARAFSELPFNHLFFYRIGAGRASGFESSGGQSDACDARTWR